MTISVKLVKRLGLAAVGAGLLALLPTTSFAAPLSGMDGLHAPATAVAADYRCWWNDSEQQCAWFDDDPGPRVYGYRAYKPYAYDVEEYRPARPATPDAYYMGSRQWWDSMEDWGRTGGQ